ncbi:MAG: hypothetical protein QM747_10725 [Nocardioides sp.]
MNGELGVLHRLGPDAEHTRAERELTAAGWTRCGVGDWAVVLASPSGQLAARISPFDPVAPYTVQLFELAAGTGQVPRLHAHRALEGGAVCTVMERLDPAGPGEAEELFAALEERRADVLDLGVALDVVLARAQAELPWCGSVDRNPANVMRRANGELVLTDPFFADGPHMYGSLTTDASQVARLIPAESRRHMFELPLAESGPWDPEGRERMRSALAAADARLGRETEP